ncbi:sensor histidine kinase [Anaerobacillus alkaliphilus]|uniref:sensor histidine kinase n=1 Tax=Anaerobacillus alkaliphilus TaxID=1548597 RepID=UPI00137635F4|nr:HAMP domain-containing sensor histidine kinase [Anaerobacillus alkaliphilus]
MYNIQKPTENFYQLLFIPFVLISWLLLTGWIMSPYYDRVSEYVTRAVLLNDKGKLIVGAIILVLIYTVTEIMIFLAAITLGQKVQRLLGKGLSVLVVIFTVFGSYFILIATFDYTLALATPIVTLLTYLFLIYKMNIWKIKLGYQAILSGQLILMMQWLEMNPAFSHFGFGKSQYMQDVINASFQLEGAHILQLISWLIFIPFFITVCLTLTLIRINMIRNEELALSQKREEELQHMKISAIESRLNDEIHSLVHDLKTPLTTIRGLISLLQLQLQKQKIGSKMDDYINKIEGSIQQLNEMISEILYKDVKREIRLQELIDYTRANFIGLHNQQVSFTINEPDEIICINRIRLVRALINLIQNAIDATKDQVDGQIDIDFSYTNAYAKGIKSEGVIITIIDNGVGMSDNDRLRIWDVRYSTKGSSGLGLPFVKKVVNDHDGRIRIDSIKNEGTTFTLFVPKGSATVYGHENNFDH